MLSATNGTEGMGNYVSQESSESDMSGGGMNSTLSKPKDGSQYIRYRDRQHTSLCMGLCENMSRRFGGLNPQQSWENNSNERQ